MHDYSQEISNMRGDLHRLGAFLAAADLRLDEIQAALVEPPVVEPPVVEPPVVEPPVVEPPVVEPPTGLIDHNNLDGTFLNPDLQDYDQNQPRVNSYGWTLRENFLSPTENLRYISHAASACLMFKGTSGLRNFHAFASSGDGCKFGYDGGSPANAVVEDGWVYGLGLNVGAHADGAQDQGGASLIQFKRVKMWMPVALGDGSKSNACLFFNSKNAGIGTVTFDNGILYGGNYTVYAINKANGKKVADVEITRTPFIVDRYTPQYGFFHNGGHGTISVDECAVYFRDRDTGLMTLIDNDPMGFDVNYWRDNNLDSNGKLIS